MVSFYSASTENTWRNSAHSQQYYLVKCSLHAMLCQVLAVLGLQKLPMHYAPCSHTEKHWSERHSACNMMMMMMCAVLLTLIALSIMLPVKAARMAAV